MCWVQTKHRVRRRRLLRFPPSLAFFALAGCALRIHTQVFRSAKCNFRCESCSRFERFGIKWMLYLASCQTGYDIGMSEMHLPLIISIRASDSRGSFLATPYPLPPAPNFLPASPLPLWAIGHISSSSNFLAHKFPGIVSQHLGQLALRNRLSSDLRKLRCLDPLNISRSPPSSFPSVDHHCRDFLTAHNFYFRVWTFSTNYPHIHRPRTNTQIPSGSNKPRTFHPLPEQRSKKSQTQLPSPVFHHHARNFYDVCVSIPVGTARFL